MSRLRIGYYLASYPAGGIARHLLTLIDQLGGAHDISVFCDSPQDNPSFAQELAARGLTARIMGRPAIGTKGVWRPILANVPVIFAARKALATARLDVAHFHAVRPSALYAPIVASRLAGIPARILTVHNSVSRRYGLKRSLEGRALASLNRIVAVCEEIKQELIEKKNVAPEKVAVIVNGVHPAEFMKPSDPGEARRALGLADTDMVAGMVGRLSRLKGADLLIRAAALLRPNFPRLRVVLIGSEREAGAMPQLAGELGVSDIVRFAGYRSDARRLMHGFDLLVHPSRKEAQSFTILEAMASAKPVVAARVGGIPGTVLDGVTGFLFPAENVPALADAVVKLLEDPEKRRAMGAAGRRRVESHFSEAAMVAATVSLYETLSAGEG